MSINLAISGSEDFEELSRITEAYGLQLYHADNCRKIWCLNTSGGFKYLKRTKLNRDELFFIYELLEYLQRGQFKTVPRLYLNLSGEPFTETDGNLYILTDWYFANELNFQTEADLKQASRFLAEFHHHAEGFEPSLPKQRTFWYSWPSKLEKRISELDYFRSLAINDKEVSAFSRLYLRYFEPFYRQAVQSYERLLDSSYQSVAYEAFQRKTVCHHDYSGRNLLRLSDNTLCLVDFDYAIRDIRIHDLINLLVRNLRHNEWSLETCNVILNEYHIHSRLSADEIEVMYILLSWPQDFWQVGLQYYVEKLPWTSKRFLRKLEHSIAARFMREKFLSEFPGGNAIFRWNEPPDNPELSFR